MIGASGALPVAGQTNSPIIITQPQSQTVSEGATNVTLFVEAVGTGTLHYQWMKNGTNLVADDHMFASDWPYLLIYSVGLSDAGTYTVVVTDDVGSVTSTPAILTVFQLSYHEPFAYPVGSNLVGQTTPDGLVWTGAGPAGTPTTIVPGSLHQPGWTNSGNSILYGNANGPSTRLSLPTPFNLTQGIIYYSFLLRVMDLGVLSNTGGYFAGFNSATGTTTITPTAVAARTLLRSAGNGLFNVGLSKNSAAVGDYVWATNQFSTNDVIFVVGSYQFGYASLWVNPEPDSFGTTFPPNPTLTSFAGVTELTNIASFIFFRRGTNNAALQPAQMVSDELRIGTTWASVTPSLSPSITDQPVDTTNVLGTIALFSVKAQGAGAEPLRYYWLKDGLPVPNDGRRTGANTDTLFIHMVNAGDAGGYSVIVSNSVGQVTSRTAQLVTIPVSPCAPGILPPAGLVGWWRGEGDAADSAGSNHGVLYTNYQFVSGQVGQAFNFNGGHLEVPAHPALNVGAGKGLTLEVWINHPFPASPDPILEWPFFNRIGAGLFLSEVTPGALEAQLTDSNFVTRTIRSAGGVVQSGGWQHLALTYDKASGLTALYVNGVVVAITNFGSFTPQTENLLSIGHRLSGTQSGRVFFGQMDEISVYSRALLPAEITSIYGAGMAGKCGAAPPVCAPEPAGIVAWWTGEGDGSDRVGQNHAQLTGVSFVAGQVGNGFGLQSLNPQIRVPASSSLDVGLGQGLTVECWFNMLSTVCPLLQWSDPTNGLGVGWFAVRSNQTVLQATLTDTNGVPRFITTLPGAIDSGFEVWQHGALTYDKSSGLATLYANGVAHAITNVGSLGLRTSGDFYIGYDAFGLFPGVAFNGFMDEVSVYNRALTAAEIASIYEARRLGKCAAPYIVRVQPGSQTAPAGTNFNLSVIVAGTTPLSYQWRKDGTNLMGATSPSYAIVAAKISDSGTYSVAVSNAFGSALSSNMVLTFTGVPPSIVSQPQNRVIIQGNSVNFSVVATGTAPLSYQWRKEGTNLPGAVNSSYAISNVQTNHAGIYSVLVSNIFGSILSSNALLIVTGAAPSIVTQPISRLVIVGSNVTFNVVANGSPPLSYQWRKDGTNLPGIVSSTYVISNVQTNHAGTYSVAISNNFGGIISSNAVLTVQPLNAPGDEFQIVALLTNNAVVVEHNQLTGDDRGGIAASATEIFYTGDSFTARFRLSDLAQGTSLGVIRDAMISDLKSGIVYHFANGATPLGGGGTATSLLEMNSSGAFTGVNITLSTPIVLNSGSGLFAGYGRIVVHNGSRVYNILMPSGLVVDLGAMSMPSHANTENWAYWGVAEFVDGLVHLVYVRDAQTIVRTRVPDVVTTTVASFVSLSDMACFTVSVPLNRWYFHHEGASQFGGLSETLGYATAVFNSSASTNPPSFVVHPQSLSVVEGASVNLSVAASGGSPLYYQWRRNGTNLPNATNALLTINNVQTNQAGAYSAVASNAYGFAVSSNAVVTVQSLNLGGEQFQITGLLTSGVFVVDHDFLTGDDRGGIAASATQVFYSGDNGTARFRLTDLGGGTSLGVVRDALISDLKTERVYSLGNGATPLGSSGGTFNSLLEMDGNTGNLTGGRINLSSSIFLNSGSGLFAGYGRVVVHNGTRVYNVALPSGQVADLGAMAMPPHTPTENWAFWGVAELFDGAIHLVYVANSQAIARTRVPGGATTNLATFASLADMACLTVSVSLNRWYFHHEGSSQFGGSFETLGFANASFDVVSTNPPSFFLHPQSRTVSAGNPVEFNAAASGAAPIRYQWRQNGTNLPGQTNGLLSIPSVQPHHAGTYSAVASNAYGFAVSTNAVLTVLTEPPLIISQPQGQTIVVGGSASFSISATGSIPLSYQWFKDGIEIPGSTASSYEITNAQLAHQGAYSVLVSNAFGSSLSSNALLVVQPLGGDDFQIIALQTSGSLVVDHDLLTGDDRGGIAASGTQLFYSGDNATARFRLQDLTSGTSLGVIRDALVSDLRSEKVYSFGNGSVPLPFGGGTANSLLEIDGTTGALTGGMIPLSTSIFIGSGSGIFAGYGRVVVHNNSRVYDIMLPSGQVLDVGAMAVPTHAVSESWAYWGVAEFFNGAIHLVYVRDPLTIARTRVPSGPTTIVASFSNLSDMSSFTVSIPLNRWYFHYEGSGQFGGTSETLGFANAQFNVVSTNPPVFYEHPQSLTIPAGSSITLSAAASGAVPVTYQWRRDGANLPGATNGSLTLSNVQTNQAGVYSAVASNAYGFAVSSNAVLTVLPAPPVILSQPQSASVLAGGTVNFSVIVTGAPPLSYQWRREGTNLPGATGSSFSIVAVQTNHAGSYSVEISNHFGRVTSANAALSVVAASGLQVLLIWDVLDNTALLLKSALEGVGIQVTLSSTSETNYNGANPSPQLFHAVIHLNGVTYDLDMPLAGQNALVNYVQNGGGYIHAEWDAYDFSIGRMANMRDLVLLERVSGGSGLMTLTDVPSQANHPILANVPSEFSFFAGYNIGPARTFTVNPATVLMRDTTGSDAVVVREFGMGRVVGFSHAATYNIGGPYNTLTNRNVQQLFISAAFWAAGFTGTNLPPFIYSQPESRSVVPGTSVSFSVGASGSSLSYRWFKDGLPLSGATGASYSIASVTTNDAGLYRATVSNAFGVVTSSNATLTVLLLPPTIVTQPQGSTVFSGANVNFNVVAGGAGPLSYQWRRDGTNLPGVTGTAYNLTNVSTNQAGIYSVLVSNPYGSTLSSNAPLVVLVPGTSFFDDFDPGIDLTQWTALNGVATNHGNVSPPNCLWFGSGLARSATSRVLDTRAGGFLSFYLRLGGSTFPWEQVDLPSEAVVLEYSTNSGSSWTLLFNYSSPTYTNWTFVEVQVPLAARASTTLFRWRQLEHSGDCCDHWALDNVLLAANPTPIPPAIITQPTNRTSVVGGVVSFSVGASGTPPLTYQWLKGELELLNATNSTLILSNAQVEDAGAYKVRVSNLYGSILSSNATLSVLEGGKHVLMSGLNMNATVQGYLAALGHTSTVLSSTAFSNASFNGYSAIWLGNTASNILAARSNDLARFVIDGGVLFIELATRLNLGSRLPFAGALVTTPANANSVRIINPNHPINRGLTSEGLSGWSQSYHAYFTAIGGYTGVADIGSSNGIVTIVLQVGLGHIVYSGQDASVHIQTGSGATGPTSPKGILVNNILTLAVAPTLTLQPASQTVTLGSNATFSASATGTAPLRYQWRFNGTNIVGATGSSFTLTNVQVSNEGAYSVQVTNKAGSALSSNAFLDINFPPVADASATLPIVISANNSNAAVVLDGSRSSDADGDDLQYLWFEAGAVLPLASGAAAVVTLSVRTNALELMVDDGRVSTRTNFTVEVLTPAQAVDRLVEVAGGGTVGNGRQLVAALNAAIASIDRSVPIAAIHQLEAFQQMVRHQVAPEDPVLAEELIAKAQEVIDSLEAGGGLPSGSGSGSKVIRVHALTKDASGGIRLEFRASRGRAHLVQASVDLVEWKTIGVAIEREPGVFEFKDPKAARMPGRFYRLLTP